MRDPEIYYSDTSIEVNEKKQLVRDVIVERLLQSLLKHRDKKNFLIAHSMGSIIASDALHKDITGVEIDTLLTIGSPLGQKYVVDKYKKEQCSSSIDKLRVPENIREHWYNLADLEDQVALKHRLSGLYKKNQIIWK